MKPKITAAVTVEVSRDSKCMTVTEGAGQIFLTRDEAIELLEAIQGKLGEMAVLTCAPRETLI
jgi:hypothetical protein